MRFLINICLVLSLIILGGVYVNAQESEETTTQEEVMEEGTGEEMTDTGDNSTETTEEDSEEKTEDASGDSSETEEMTEEELTEEEIEEILEEEEVLEEEDIESLEDLEGEVVAVTDDEVIIETEDGEVIVVPTEVYEQKRGGGGSSKKAKVGEKIETASVFEVKQEGDNWIVTTNRGTFVIPRSTPVTMNGKTINVSELANLEKDAEVVVVTDKEGNVIALEILGEELEKTSNILMVGTIIAIVVIILLALIFRKKKSVV